MTKFSDNDSPSLLFSEQGSAPTTPATGKWRLYTKSTGLYIVDDAGASTGPFGASTTGAELDYVQVTAATTNITATTEATANTLITGSSVAYDGSTAVIIEFFAPGMVTDTSSGSSVLIWLYDGASSIGAIGGVVTPAASAVQVPVLCRTRITPSAASHTYSIRASTSAGTAVMDAGAGGTGVYRPAYIRITKV